MTHDNDKTRGSMGLSDKGLDRVAIMLNTQKAIDIIFSKGAGMPDEQDKIDNHTPAPWHVGEKRGSIIDINHSDSAIGAISGTLAKVTSRVTWLAESEANARLIAAAPELLEALEEARTHIVELCDCHDHPYPESSFRRYDKVIAKARGQA